MTIQGSLVDGVKVTRVMNAVAAGTTTQYSATADMSQSQGVMFLTALGAITATSVTEVKATENDDTDISDGNDIAGSGQAVVAGGADDHCVVIHDIYRPGDQSITTGRYVGIIVLRGTANCVIDGIFAIQYGLRRMPATQDTTVHYTKRMISPVAGTA